MYDRDVQKNLVSGSPFGMMMAALLASGHCVKDLIQGMFETLHP